MKKFIHLISLVGIVLFLLVPSSVLKATPTSTESVDQLFDQRAKLISESRYDELPSFHEQLLKYGVHQLGQAETQALRVKKSDSTLLSLFRSAPSDATPATGANSSEITWFSSRTIYTHDGQDYEIQTLLAQANEHDSLLKQSGSFLLPSSQTKLVSLFELITGDLGSPLKEPPLLVSLYKTFLKLIPSFSAPTALSSRAIGYSYANVTTVVFKYVKKVGEADEAQRLCHLSTKCNTAVAYQYPDFIVHGDTVLPDLVQEKRSLSTTPEHYNSNEQAIAAYVRSNGLHKDCVTSIKITGSESETTFSLYPVNPEFPYQFH